MPAGLEHACRVECHRGAKCGWGIVLSLHDGRYDQRVLYVSHDVTSWFGRVNGVDRQRNSTRTLSVQLGGGHFQSNWFNGSLVAVSPDKVLAS